MARRFFEAARTQVPTTGTNAGPSLSPRGRSSGSGTYARAPVRRVLTHPDPRLQSVAAEIDPEDPAAVALAEALVFTMSVSPACVGLAAPQINEDARMICVDVTDHKKARSCAGLIVLANPRVVERRGNVIMREGCMSVPNLTGDVARAAEVVVEGFEPGTGRLVRIEANAMEARCLLHEIDHLDGILFIDRVQDPVAELFQRKSFK